MTVTFCEGDPEAAFAALKKRLSAVINANPWVAGQLVKKRLVHPQTGSDTLVDEILSMQKCAAVTRSTLYPKLVKAVAGNPALAVQKGAVLQKTKARVTKVVVVAPEATGREFALIFSMSHVVADGHDYYRILNMLAGTAPVEAMSAERVAAYEAREPEWTGAKDFKWLSGGAGLIKGMLGGLLFGPKAKWCCYEVDAAKVAKAKEQAAGNIRAPYVSTNDVITSHFCRNTRARVCMMVLNMRGKISLPISDAHAGCYEGCLLLDPNNSNEPSKVRACLRPAGAELDGRKEPYTRQEPDTPPLPGACGSCPMAFITSWASFPFELALDGIEQQTLHLPCMAMPDMMDVAVVFKSKPGTLAVLYMAKRATPAALTAEDTVLGATVDEGLFPP